MGRDGTGVRGGWLICVRVAAAGLLAALCGCAAPAGEPQEAPPVFEEEKVPPMRQDNGAAGTPREAAPASGPIADPEPAAPAEEVSVGVVDDAFRPDWWLEQPTDTGGTLRLSAMADAATVRDSRRGAVTQGEGLAAAWSGVAPRNGEVERTRTVRLPSGYYRTFVTMSWTMREPGKKSN